MMRLRVLGLLLALLPALPAAAQESVVTGLSLDSIALTADFDGSEIFVFGAIRRDGPIPPSISPLDIIITIKGPERPVTVRRKERRFGIWVNTEAVNVRGAPSFYAIATTRPLDILLTETERLRHGIGMDQAVRRFGSHPTIKDTRPFAEAVVRIRKSNHLYEQRDDTVLVTEDTLFQTEFELPANIVEGEYEVEFFLVRDQAVTGSGSTGITVEKTGIERWLYNLAQQEPLAYGVLAVFVALLAGWAAAAVFQLARR